MSGGENALDLAAGRLAAFQAEASRVQAERIQVETRAVAALEGAAKRIERMAGEAA